MINHVLVDLRISPVAALVDGEPARAADLEGWAGGGETSVEVEGYRYERLPESSIPLQEAMESDPTDYQPAYVKGPSVLLPDGSAVQYWWRRTTQVRSWRVIGQDGVRIALCSTREEAEAVIELVGETGAMLGRPAPLSSFETETVAHPREPDPRLPPDPPDPDPIIRLYSTPTQKGRQMTPLGMASIPSRVRNKNPERRPYGRKQQRQLHP